MWTGELTVAPFCGVQIVTDGCTAPGVHTGDADAPVPLSVATCGLAGSELVTCRLPLRLPATVGLNAISMWQLAPDARLVPQFVLAMEKSPVGVTSVICRSVSVRLANVKDFAELIVPTTWLPKLMLEGSKFTAASLTATKMFCLKTTPFESKA